MTPRPLCRQCGKKISKYTTLVMLAANYDRPTTSEALHALVAPTLKDGAEIASFRRVGTAAGGQRISGYYVWDGKSYVDDFFCTNRCAITFARHAARGGLSTSLAYEDALKRQRGEKVK